MNYKTPAMDTSPSTDPLFDAHRARYARKMTQRLEHDPIYEAFYSSVWQVVYVSGYDSAGRIHVQLRNTYTGETSRSTTDLEGNLRMGRATFVRLGNCQRSTACRRVARLLAGIS
jgi:hypothetical protein